MRTFFSRILLVVAWFATAYGGAFHLIGSDGAASKLSNQVGTLLSSATQEEGTTQLVPFVDLTTNLDAYSVINKIMSTSFDSLSNGAQIDLAGNGPACILATFDAVRSEGFCGNKAIQYLMNLNVPSVVTVVSTADLQECMSGFSGLLKRFLGKQHQLVIIANGKHSDADVNSAYQRMLNEWKLESEEEYESIKQRISLIACDAEDSDSCNAVRKRVLEIVPNIAVAGLSSRLLQAPQSPNAEELPLTVSERRALLAVDKAFSTCLLLIEGTSLEWQRRIQAKKTVGKFNARVKQLLMHVQQHFYEQTDGSIMAKERVERGKQLVEAIKVATTNAFNQQLVTLQSHSVERFKNALKTSLKTPTAGEMPSFSPEVGQQTMRQTLYNFRVAVGDLEVSEFELSADSAQGELSNTLQTALSEFPESHAGKLAILSSMDKQVRAAASKKKSKSISWGLTLVSMLRPPGHGNLQGYATYASSLLGVPVDFLFGVQNDGDSPEVVGEDREHPILRLQPKISCDIDL